MEIRTTEELWHHYPKVCYAGVEHNLNDLNACSKLSNKKWVSVGSILERIRQADKEKENLAQFGALCQAIYYELRDESGGK